MSILLVFISVVILIVTSILTKGPSASPPDPSRTTPNSHRAGNLPISNPKPGHSVMGLIGFLAAGLFGVALYSLTTTQYGIWVALAYMLVTACIVAWRLRRYYN